MVLNPSVQPEDEIIFLIEPHLSDEVFLISSTERKEQMEENRYLFTSESVTEGHPDKVCDQIADKILDEILAEDPLARVACECIATTGMVYITGEISTDCYVDIPHIAREVIREIGYDSSDSGFDWETCAVLTSIGEQSGDIAMGVNRAMDSQENQGLIGAGDQGMMFGYACDETPELMPMPIVLAHKLCKRLAVVRKDRILNYLRPDGKAQVSVEYLNGKVDRVATVVVSTQHDPDVPIEQLRKEIYDEVICKVIPEDLMDEETHIYINPTGRFVLGGPKADSGLTGRKIIVDTYGGFAPHGGGSFSGKDPTKVDRSATYMARYAAKNLVAAGLAKQCMIELAYAIGVAQPVSLFVDTKGTGVISDEDMSKLLLESMDFTPQGIIDTLDLRRPLYYQVASYGHFGRNDLDLPWEKTDKVDLLRENAKKYPAKA